MSIHNQGVKEKIFKKWNNQWKTYSSEKLRNSEKQPVYLDSFSEESKKMLVGMEFTDIQLFNYSRENDTCSPRLYYVSVKTESRKKSFFVSCSMEGNNSSNAEVLSTKNIMSTEEEKIAIVHLFNEFCLTDFIVELVHPSGIIGKVMNLDSSIFTVNE